MVRKGAANMEMHQLEVESRSGPILKEVVPRVQTSWGPNAMDPTASVQNPCPLLYEVNIPSHQTKERGVTGLGAKPTTWKRQACGEKRADSSGSWLGQGGRRKTGETGGVSLHAPDMHRNKNQKSYGTEIIGSGLAGTGQQSCQPT